MSKFGRMIHQQMAGGSLENAFKQTKNTTLFSYLVNADYDMLTIIVIVIKYTVFACFPAMGKGTVRSKL